MAETGLVWACPGCGGRLAEAPGALRCGACDRAVPEEDGVWRILHDFRPEGFPPERRSHLEALERSHFWFGPRRRLLVRLLERAEERGASAAVDLGCGCGGFLAELARRYAVVVGIDAYGESLAVARSRAAGAVLVEGDACRVPLAGDQFDLAVALDVLEHLEPARLLREARRLVRPGGWLLVSVPAYAALWSRLDEEAGHRRRYDRRLLARQLSDSGWTLEHWTHYQAALLPLVWLGRRLPVASAQRLERHPPAPVGRLLGGVNALEVRLFGRRRLPFGSSLCALARRVG